MKPSKRITEIQDELIKQTVPLINGMRTYKKELYLNEAIVAYLDEQHESSNSSK